MLKQLRRTLRRFLIILLTTVFLGFTSPQPAVASIHVNVALPKPNKILSNKQLIAEKNKFLSATPERFCRAYFDKLNGIDSSTWVAIEEGVTSTFIITQAVSSASAAGAGALAGYAGVASAVSQLGLGGMTTAIAGMMGSSVSGAAATAVVTSAVGGPIIMGTLLAGGTGAAAFGTYELGKFTVQKLGSWAEGYCSSNY